MVEILCSGAVRSWGGSFSMYSIPDTRYRPRKVFHYKISSTYLCGFRGGYYGANSQRRIGRCVDKIWSFSLPQGYSRQEAKSGKFWNTKVREIYLHSQIDIYRARYSLMGCSQQIVERHQRSEFECMGPELRQLSAIWRKGPWKSRETVSASCETSEAKAAVAWVCGRVRRLAI